MYGRMRIAIFDTNRPVRPFWENNHLTYKVVIVARMVLQEWTTVAILTKIFQQALWRNVGCHQHVCQIGLQVLALHCQNSTEGQQDRKRLV